MKRVIVATLATLLFAVPALAAQSSTNFTVSTDVVGECNVSTTPVVFSGYDGSVPVVAQGTVTVQCTGGLIYHIALDQGQHFGVGKIVDRTMVNGSQDLYYRLYQPDGTTQWGDAGYGDTFTAGSPVNGIGNGYNQVLAVKGELYGGNPVVGTYSDIVNVTVNF